MCSVLIHSSGAPLPLSQWKSPGNSQRESSNFINDSPNYICCFLPVTGDRQSQEFSFPLSFSQSEGQSGKKSNSFLWLQHLLFFLLQKENGMSSSFRKEKVPPHLLLLDFMSPSTPSSLLCSTFSLSLKIPQSNLNFVSSSVFQLFPFIIFIIQIIDELPIVSSSYTD